MQGREQDTPWNRMKGALREGVALAVLPGIAAALPVADAQVPITRGAAQQPAQPAAQVISAAEFTRQYKVGIAQAQQHWQAPDVALTNKPSTVFTSGKDARNALDAALNDQTPVKGHDGQPLVGPNAPVLAGLISLGQQLKDSGAVAFGMAGNEQLAPNLRGQAAYGLSAVALKVTKDVGDFAANVRDPVSGRPLMTAFAPRAGDPNYFGPTASTLPATKVRFDDSARQLDAAIGVVQELSKTFGSRSVSIGNGLNFSLGSHGVQHQPLPPAEQAQIGLALNLRDRVSGPISTLIETTRNEAMAPPAPPVQIVETVPVAGQARPSVDDEWNGFRVSPVPENLALIPAARAANNAQYALQSRQIGAVLAAGTAAIKDPVVQERVQSLAAREAEDIDAIVAKVESRTGAHWSASARAAAGAEATTGFGRLAQAKAASDAMLRDPAFPRSDAVTGELVNTGRKFLEFLHREAPDVYAEPAPIRAAPARPGHAALIGDRPGANAGRGVTLGL